GWRQRPLAVEHYGDLLRAALANARFVEPRMRAVRDPGGVKSDAPRSDAASRGELRARVIEDLVDVDGRMRVGARDRVRVKVERPGDEARDQRSSRREGAVPGRGQVHGADPRLEQKDRKGEWVDRAVPADDVERRILMAEAMINVAPFHDDVAD